MIYIISRAFARFFYMIVTFFITTGVTGLSPKVVRTLAISSTVSMPLTTLPKAA